MNQDKLNEVINSIGSKLGEDVKATIADDLGTLITLNENAVKEYQKVTEENSQLKDTNAKLVSANGALLQQVPQVKVEPEASKEEITEPKYFDYHSAFDKNGNVKL